MDDQTNRESCKESVMNRIAGESICPRPKLFFQSRECAVWALWMVSVVIGALAFAVTGFVISHHEYALYEATHENFATFMIGALPYLWILTFGVMAVVAVYNLRHTKHGYRYPLWQIFVSSFVLSIAGGAVLQLFGLGYAVDHMLGRQMSMYASEGETETMLWQNPEDGRLLGRVTEAVGSTSPEVVFTDVSGVPWVLDVSELSSTEREVLVGGQQVKLIGEITEGNRFHSCGAFPWLLDRPATRADFMAVRQAFENKMHSYEESAEKMAHIKDGDENEEDEIKESQCRKIAPVRRMVPMLSR